jgi:AraC-like DNA-binding protein
MSGMHGTAACTSTAGHGTRGKANELRRLIEARQRERITLRELGRALGLSPFQVLRLFRRHHGVTPHQYLVRLRVAEASRLLRHGEPIAAVAAEVGFADQSHMARHFKRLLGVTPSHYRDHGMATSGMVA